MFIAVGGTLTDGYRFYGTFETNEEAAAWIRSADNVPDDWEWMSIELTAPS